MSALDAVLGLQRASGAFPSIVSSADDDPGVEDETCFVTASVALALAEIHAPDPRRDAARCAALDRALDFVERCEHADAPGAFGFYPHDGSGPRVVAALPPDADDTALAWLVLLAGGRRDVAAARAAYRGRILPHALAIVAGDAPPWARPGTLRTWLVEQGRRNPIDLVVNANVAAFAARIGETAAGACAGLLAARRYDAITFARHLAPFYASICELRLAVVRAITFGAAALTPCLDWLAATPGDPFRVDKPLYCNTHGRPLWRSQALQQARRLTSSPRLSLVSN